MHRLQLYVGIFYIIAPFVLLPIYLRILYIFISKKQYRDVESYRIMIAIGIIQCVTMPVGFSLSGLAHVFDYDPYDIASMAIRLYPGGFRTEALLSLVLALDRLKIICKLQYPAIIHKVIMLLSVLIGITFSALLFSPLCWYGIVPGEYLMEYDMSIPSCVWIEYIGSYFLTVPSCLTLLVYITIIAYLARMKFKMGSYRGSADERRIFLYAMTRFVVDFSFVSTYHYANLPHRPLFDIPLNVGLLFTGLLVPPVLYLLLYR